MRCGGWGFLAEEGAKNAYRHHRRYDPRAGVAARFCRYQGLCGLLGLVGAQVGCAQRIAQRSLLKISTGSKPMRVPSSKWLLCWLYLS